MDELAAAERWWDEAAEVLQESTDGEFDDKTRALAAMSALPERIRQHRPYLRSLKILRRLLNGEQLSAVDMHNFLNGCAVKLESIVKSSQAGQKGIMKNFPRDLIMPGMR